MRSVLAVPALLFVFFATSCQRVDSDVNAFAAYLVGLDYEQNGDYRGALGAYERSLRADGRSTRVLRRLARCHWMLGDARSGVGVYERAIELEPDNSVLHFELGLFFVENNYPGYALRELTIAHRLSPHDPEAGLALGALFEKQSQWEQALAVYETLLAGGNANSRKPVLEGVKRCTKQLYPERHAFAEFMTALDAEAAGRYDEAIAAYQRALADQPRSVELLRRMGLCYLHAGNKTDGLRCYQQAILLDSKNSKLYEDVGLYCKQQEWYDQAVYWLAQAFALDGENFSLASQLGESYIKQDCWVEALAVYEAILPYSPNPPKVREIIDILRRRIALDSDEDSE